jgi:hypothetical protein
LGREARMNRLIERFGKLTTASFFVMVLGIVVFLISIPLYANYGIDTDIIGFLIFSIGLAICVIGIIRRKKLHGWKLAVLSVLAAVLLLQILPLIVSLVYYSVTGKPLGG